MPPLVFATVVTEHLLPEHLLLRRSLELFEPVQCPWYIRCDRASFEVLSRLEGTHCEIFAEAVDEPCDQDGPLFREIVGQKMLAMETAWQSGAAGAVLLLDCDLIAVSPIVNALSACDGEVVISPNYYRNRATKMVRRFGAFNSGVVLTRTPAFHRWWRAAFLDAPERFTDQGCLDLAPERFQVVELDPAWNVGYWRRETRWHTPNLPPQMRFFHAHVSKPAQPDREYELGQKTFVLDLLDFLQQRGGDRDRDLIEAIVRADASGFYAAMLGREVTVLTHCDPARAVRLLLMARSTPPQVPIVCAVNGSASAVQSRLGSEQLPPHVTLVEQEACSPYPTNRLRNAAFKAAQSSFVCCVDVDFVFRKGFWYLLFDRCSVPLGEGHGVCPLPMWSPHDDRVGAASLDEFLRSEAPSDHRLPETRQSLPDAQIFKYHDRWHPSESSHARYVDITDRMLALRHTRRAAEPWVILRRDRCVLADEDFCGRVADKQQFVSALLDRGLRFVVSDDLFIFHLWHPDTRAADMRPERSYNIELWSRRYAGKAHRYLLLHQPTCGSAAVTSTIGRVVRTIAADGHTAASAPDVDIPFAATSEAECVTALRREVPFVHAALPFSPAFVGFGYRIVAVVRNPVTWHAARFIGRYRSRGAAEEQRHDACVHEIGARHTCTSFEEYVSQGHVTDGWLTRFLASGEHDPVSARRNASQLAFVIDVEHIDRSSQVASNVLGIPVQLPPILEDCCVQSLAEPAAWSIATVAPDDCSLYEALRQLQRRPSGHPAHGDAALR